MLSRTQLLLFCSILVILDCSSGPRPIPISQTRALSAAHPTLAALEQQIATKKTEQDALELRLSQMSEQREQSPKDEKLKQQLERLEKENALCQAELAALIGRHQLESARLLKRPDVAEHENAVEKLNATVAERRTALAGGK